MLYLIYIYIEIYIQFYVFFNIDGCCDVQADSFRSLMLSTQCNKAIGSSDSVELMGLFCVN